MRLTQQIVSRVSDGVASLFDPYGVSQTTPFVIKLLADAPDTPRAVRDLAELLRQRRGEIPAVLRSQKDQDRITIMVGQLVRALYKGRALETRLAAVEALSHHPDDQVALHHAAFHDPETAIRVAAARKITREDLDPLAAMSDVAEVRLAFVETTHLKGLVIAMSLCDPDLNVKRAADQSLKERDAELRGSRDDSLSNAYYRKFNR